MSRDKFPKERKEPSEAPTGGEHQGSEGNAQATDQPATKQIHEEAWAERRRELEETIQQLRKDIEQSNDVSLRTLAECDNSRKRLQRERDEYAKYATEKIVRALLPIVDSLDQALVAIEQPSEAQAIIKGIRLISRQLASLMEKEGVQRIAAIGEPFDPHRHEAVAQVETGDGQPENTVAEEIQVGYTMHGKVIRPAMVKVAGRSAAQQEDVRDHEAEVGGQKSEASHQKAAENDEASDIRDEV